VDEKIPYALDDMKALRVPGCIAYAGTGFSEGIMPMLEASNVAASFRLEITRPMTFSRIKSRLNFLKNGADFLVQ
jgi:hypothetical protein